MVWASNHLLTLVVFFPLLWGVLGLLASTGRIFPDSFQKFWALLGMLLTFGFSLFLWKGYLLYGPEFQFVERATWIPKLGIQYVLGIDGISLLLMLLTTFLGPLLVLGSFRGIQKRETEYYFYLLFLQTAMLGAFCALDVFLFYVFWEAMLIPMYFLIGIWGHQDRVYAAMKFFLYTLVGSLLMLVAIFYLAWLHKVQFGNFSTNLLDLYRLRIDGGGIWTAQSLLFLAFALAFAIKVPLFPFHTWLPDAHVQAPTAGSVVLAGVLLKLGGYGFIRFAFPLFPLGVIQFQGLFFALGAIAIIYGAWVAWYQPDLKKLIAYSSVSHMGYVIVGLFSLHALSVTGSVYQMLNHGISTGALFFLVGILYERAHTRTLSQFGGLAKKMPFFAAVFVIVGLSSMALPGTNGFVGEFLILLGLWKVNHWICIFSTLGAIFGAVYMLWAIRKVLFGPFTNKKESVFSDLSFREMVLFIPFIVAIFVMGLAPNLFLKSLTPSVHRFLARTLVYHTQHGYAKTQPLLKQIKQKKITWVKE